MYIYSITIWQYIWHNNTSIQCCFRVYFVTCCIARSRYFRRWRIYCPSSSRCRWTERCEFILKMMSFTPKMMSFVPKLLEILPKMMDYVRNVMGFVPKMMDSVQKMMDYVLNNDGFYRRAPPLWTARTVSTAGARAATVIFYDYFPTVFDCFWSNFGRMHVFWTVFDRFSTFSTVFGVIFVVFVRTAALILTLTQLVSTTQYNMHSIVCTVKCPVLRSKWAFLRSAFGLILTENCVWLLISCYILQDKSGESVATTTFTVSDMDLFCSNFAPRLLHLAPRLLYFAPFGSNSAPILLHSTPRLLHLAPLVLHFYSILLHFYSTFTSSLLDLYSILPPSLPPSDCQLMDLAGAERPSKTKEKRFSGSEMQLWGFAKPFLAVFSHF